MAKKRIDDMLKNPESIPIEHTCNFGDQYLKYKGIIAAKLLDRDFNAIAKMALDAFVQDLQAKRKAEFDGLLKMYPYRAAKKK